jgi:hypothetical protein
MPGLPFAGGLLVIIKCYQGVLCVIGFKDVDAAFDVYGRCKIGGRGGAIGVCGCTAEAGIGGNGIECVIKIIIGERPDKAAQVCALETIV